MIRYYSIGAVMLLLAVLCAISTIAHGQIAQCLPNDDHIVRTQQGLVRGCQLRSRSGRPIATFRGIRYAKPPLGNLRFAAPQPADPWPEMIDTVDDAPQCVQKNYLLPNPNVDGQEDCLFLNVYTNKLPSLNDNVKRKRPVMVYIHGGGWFAGSGASYVNGPEYLLDEDIVLVTMNYRLGVLGFLSTQDDEATGNWGLKDQILALKWVQDNIEGFGGDPKSVTIFGQSAGASSVHYLVLSPTTKGLFHKAICQSGSALNLWATPKNSLEIAKTQGSFVDCSFNKSSELVKCLREVDVQTLIRSGDKFKFWDVDPLTIFVPTIEIKSAKNPTPFIDEHPSKLVKSGKFNKVPLIMGIMENEGIVRAAPITTQSKLRTELNARWDTLGPELFALSDSVPRERMAKLWTDMTKFYMRNGDRINENNSDNIQNFVDIYTDRSFTYGMFQTARGHAKHVPVYFYKIQYSGQYSYSPIFAGSNETVNHTFSVCHCDDLIYLFRAPVLFPDTAGVDLDFSKVLVKMWTAFAKDGAPFGRFWTPLKSGSTPTKFRHLNMAGPKAADGSKKEQINLSMKSNFLSERINFWLNQDVAENR